MSVGIFLFENDTGHLWSSGVVGYIRSGHLFLFLSRQEDRYSIEPDAAKILFPTIIIMTILQSFIVLLLSAALIPSSHASTFTSSTRGSDGGDSSNLQPQHLNARQASPTCGPAGGCIPGPGTSDCCGPTGRSTILSDTCYTTANVTTTNEVFGVTCLTGTGNVLQASSPETYYTATVICDNINNGTAGRNTWFWSMPVSGFALGVWLPGNSGDAPCPYWDSCYGAIYYRMIQGCSTSPGSTGASINLAQLPDTTQTGQAIDPGYPSYIMAAQPLT